jgi:hypothetical protein
MLSERLAPRRDLKYSANIPLTEYRLDVVSSVLIMSLDDNPTVSLLTLCFGWLLTLPKSIEICFCLAYSEPSERDTTAPEFKN